MSGRIPAAMFTTPMPAVNYANAQNGGQGAALSSFFSSGQFNTSPVSFTGNAEPGADTVLGSSAANATALVVANGSPWFQWGPHKSMLPDELRSAYVNHASPYAADFVHVTGSNVEGAADFSNLQDVFTRLGASGLGNQIGPTQWSRMMMQLDKARCTSPTGDGGISGADFASQGQANWLQGLVASIKTQQSGSSDMRQKFYKDTGDFDDLWSTTFEWIPGSPLSGFYYRTTGAPGSGNWSGPASASQWAFTYPVIYHHHQQYTDCNSVPPSCCPNGCDNYWDSETWSLNDLHKDRGQLNITWITPDLRVPFSARDSIAIHAGVLDRHEPEGIVYAFTPTTIQPRFSNADLHTQSATTSFDAYLSHFHLSSSLTYFPSVAPISAYTMLPQLMSNLPQRFFGSAGIYYENEVSEGNLRLVVGPRVRFINTLSPQLTYDPASDYYVYRGWPAHLADTATITALSDSRINTPKAIIDLLLSAEVDRRAQVNMSFLNVTGAPYYNVSLYPRLGFHWRIDVTWAFLD